MALNEEQTKKVSDLLWTHYKGNEWERNFPVVLNWYVRETPEEDFPGLMVELKAWIADEKKRVRKPQPIMFKGEPMEGAPGEAEEIKKL